MERRRITRRWKKMSSRRKKTSRRRSRERRRQTRRLKGKKKKRRRRITNNKMGPRNHDVRGICELLSWKFQKFSFLPILIHTVRTALNSTNAQSYHGVTRASMVIQRRRPSCHIHESGAFKRQIFFFKSLSDRNTGL